MSEDQAEPSPISVFLMDDHEIVRQGVRDLLEAQPDIRVVGEAGTAASALARIPALRPDVAILDVRLPDGDGVSVCREIRSRMPEVACLMLTSYGDDEALFDAVMAGAAGYVLKDIRGTDLVGDEMRGIGVQPERARRPPHQPRRQVLLPGLLGDHHDRRRRGELLQVVDHHGQLAGRVEQLPAEQGGADRDRAGRHGLGRGGDPAVHGDRGPQPLPAAGGDDLQAPVGQAVQHRAGGRPRAGLGRGEQDLELVIVRA